MKTKLYLTLALLAVAACLVVFETTSAGAAGFDDNALGVSATGTLRRIYPFQSAAYTSRTSSTTVEILAATTGRTRLCIYPSVVTSAGVGELHVGIGTTTVAVTGGRVVTNTNPLEIDIDDGVAVSMIASTAFVFSVVQLSY